MNKFIKKLFFFKLGLITILLPFNPIKNLFSETLNKSFEDEINKACSKLAEFDLLLGIHSEALERLYPNLNWFEIKKKNEMLKDFC